MAQQQPQTALEGYRAEMARRKEQADRRTQYGSVGASLLAALDVAIDPETGTADAGMAAMRAVARVGQELKESVEIEKADALIVSLDHAVENVLADPSKRNRLDKVRQVLGVMVAAARQAHADRNPPPAALPEPVVVPYVQGWLVQRAPVRVGGQDNPTDIDRTVEDVEIEAFAWNGAAARQYGLPVGDGVDAQRITVRRPVGALPPPPPRAAGAGDAPGERVELDGDDLRYWVEPVPEPVEEG